MIVKYMHQAIITLLDARTELQAQVKVIEQLNLNMFDEDVLFELASTLRKNAKLINGLPFNTVDIVGTGGDGFDTLNFSTMSAMLAAKAGVNVAKHGNKSATSKCGSFDLLMKMGVTIPQIPKEALDEFAQNHLVFLFAPYFHPMMKNVAEARKVFSARGERTIFNLMGPLINPGCVKCMLVGVYKKELVEPYAKVLSKLGVEYGIVAYGDGLDELTITGPSNVAIIKQGHITLETWQPEDFGLKRAVIDDLVGAGPDENLVQTEQILAGELPGPKTDMVLFNTAAAISVASGFDLSIGEAIEKAKQALN